MTGYCPYCNQMLQPTVETFNTIYNGQTYESVTFKCSNAGCMRILGVTLNPAVQSEWIVREVVRRLGHHQQ